MIHEVDEALRTLIRREALNGSDVDVVFDAPTKDWAARRNAPTLDVYLYDIREDLKWKAYGSVDVKGANGHTRARQGPPRYFKLSYLITAWTQRPEDEHRLLSAVLVTFLKDDALPTDTLTGILRANGVPVRTSIAQPPAQDRNLSDVWSALGGELKPSLDLICLVAIDATGEQGVATLVSELPRFSFSGAAGEGGEAGEEEASAAERRRRRRGGAPGDKEEYEPAVAEETVTGGAARRRSVGTADGAEGRADGDDGGTGDAADGESASQEGEGGEAGDRPGLQPGRIFRFRNSSER